VDAWSRPRGRPSTAPPADGQLTSRRRAQHARRPRATTSSGVVTAHRRCTPDQQRARVQRQATRPHRRRAGAGLGQRPHASADALGRSRIASAPRSSAQPPPPRLVRGLFSALTPDRRNANRGGGSPRPAVASEGTPARVGPSRTSRQPEEVGDWSCSRRLGRAGGHGSSFVELVKQTTINATTTERARKERSPARSMRRGTSITVTPLGPRPDARHLGPPSRSGSSRPPPA